MVINRQITSLAYSLLCLILLGAPGQCRTLVVDGTQECALTKGDVLQVVGQVETNGLKSVELRIDFKAVDVAGPQARFTLKWRTFTATAGPHRVELFAIRQTGPQRLSTCWAEVFESSPLVITSPKEGAELVLDTPCKVTTAKGLTVRQLHLLLDDVPLPSNASGRPMIPVGTLSEGKHTLVVEAETDVGKMASEPVSFAVPKRVSVIEPAAERGITWNAVKTEVKVAVAVNAGLTPSKISVLCDGREVGEIPAQATETVCDLTSAGAGAHQLTARVYDSSGTFFDSEARTIHLDRPELPAQDQVAKIKSPLGLGFEVDSVEKGRAALIAAVEAGARTELDIPRFLELCWNGDLENARKVVESKDTNAVDDAGFTAAHYAVLGKHMDILKMLSERYLPLDVAANNGVTPLHMAALIGDKELVKWLLQKHCDPNKVWVLSTESQISATPLGLVIPGKDLGLAYDLIKAGANVNSPQVGLKGFTALHLAVATSSFEMVRLMLTNKADVNARTYEGYTPLWLACAHNWKLLPLLLAAGASPDSSIDGKTPLHAAIYAGNITAVDLLLKYHANPSLADPSTEFTPLHMAAASGSLAIVQRLLAAGAEVNALNVDGFTPLDMALALEHRLVALAIRKAHGRTYKELLNSAR